MATRSFFKGVLMAKVTIIISMEEDFSEKFLGFLQNLSSVNENPFKVDSVQIDNEIIAYPKEKL